MSLLLSLVLAGCGVIDRTDCTVLEVACPDGAPLLGAPGWTDEQLAIDWSWNEDCQASVGPATSFTLADDTVSVSVTVDAGSTPSGIALLHNAGTSWVDFTSGSGPGLSEGPLWHDVAEAGTVVLPMDDRTLPAAGCLTVVPFADDDRTGEADTLHVVSRRGAGTAVDLNIVNVQGSGITQAQIQQALDRMETIWGTRGAGTIGDVRWATTEFGGGFVDSEGEDIGALRASFDAAPGTMTVFFIADFSDEAGTLGIASGIPGPLGIAGTRASGLVLSVDSHLDADLEVDTTMLGGTLTHELGHQFGLFHTSEEDGSAHDGISDTPECPRSANRNLDRYVDADECAELGGRNVMFWTSTESFAQEELTPIQASVFANSPVMR